MVRGLRAISPVIATVIILAVTIAIAIAVVGWITGLFGATTKGTASLKFYPDSYINATSTSIGGGNAYYALLHVRNEGSADATITKIVIDGLGTFNQDDIAILMREPSASDLANVNNFTGRDVVAAGKEAYIVVKINAEPTPGTIYTVHIYTADGNVYSGTVVAKK